MWYVEFRRGDKVTSRKAHKSLRVSAKFAALCLEQLARESADDVWVRLRK